MPGTKVFCLPESLPSPEELIFSCQTAQRQFYFYSMPKTERRGERRRGERQNKNLIGPWFFRVDWERWRIYSCVAFSPTTHRCCWAAHLAASLCHHASLPARPVSDGLLAHRCSFIAVCVHQKPLSCHSLLRHIVFVLGNAWISK